MIKEVVVDGIFQLSGNSKTTSGLFRDETEPPVSHHTRSKSFIQCVINTSITHNHLEEQKNENSFLAFPFSSSNSINNN